MKIGLITIFQVPNYGSLLQTFATQKVIESMGHECIVINYNYRNEDFYKKQGLKRNRIRELLLAYIPWIKSGKLYRFRKKNLNLSKLFETYEDLNNNDWSSFDLFIVGSDQVWNTKYIYGDPAFLLKFAPDNVKRISLSSSFALDSLPTEFSNAFKKELERFNALSVRELNGARIIQEQLKINKDVFVSLDPTFLLSRSEWMNSIPRSSFIKKKPYILLYMWTYAFEPRPYILRVIEYFSNKLDADIIVLEGHRELQDLHRPFIDKNNSNINEFIDLFAYADLVITSSFHGTAFAINFGIPLISIVPNGNVDDRQSSVLRMIGADSSIVHINDSIENINPFYNKDIVEDKLKSHVAKCKDWILSNILE